MKKFLLFLVCMSSIVVQAQSSEYIGKKLNGQACDSCELDYQILQSPTLSVILKGTSKVDGEENNQVGNIGDHVYKPYNFVITGANFDLVFIPNAYTFNYRKPKVADEDMEYCIYQSGRLVKNWSKMVQLPTDSSIYFNRRYIELVWDDVQVAKKEPKLIGAFNLQIGDSLIALVRNAKNNEIFQKIIVKRKKLTPRLLGYFSFSEKDSLEQVFSLITNDRTGQKNYLLKRFNVVSVEEKRQSDFDLDIGKTGVFYFGKDVEKMEFAYGDDPQIWKELKSRYLLIRNSSPGKTIELLLRYKDQPETIRRIKIHVQEKFTSSTVFKTGAGFMLALLLFGVWYYFRKKQHKRQLQNLQRHQEETESKLELLSGQLNPHFLFNSLNAVRSLMLKKEYEKADHYTSQIAGFLRIVMENGRKEYISLQQELGIEEQYMQLEQKRKAFQYQISNKTQTDISTIEFPPLLLQPIIENAIVHGFTGQFDNGKLTINISTTGNDVLVAVCNNGKPLDVRVMAYGHGLSLVQKRIDLLNQNNEGFHISMDIVSALTGTSVTFTFKNWF